MITAQITEFSVPSQLRVGDNLDISFRYTASNSEWSVFNSKWRTFAVASVPGIGDFLLDDSVRSWEILILVPKLELSEKFLKLPVSQFLSTCSPLLMPRMNGPGRRIRNG